MNKKITHNYLNTLLKLSIFLYITLCTTHWLNQRPLWNDEQAVFLSIQAFSFEDFFSKPLIQWQVFPRVYLFIIQQISSVFEHTRLSVRSPSFICMLSAFFIWLKIANKECPSPFSKFLFIFSWCASVPLIYYSAELKQYSMDVLTASIYIFFLLNQEKYETIWNPSRYRWTLASLPIMSLFSYPSNLFLCIVLFNLIIAWINDHKKWQPILVFLTSCACLLTISYHYDMQYRHLDAVSKGFSDYFVSFTSIGEFFRTLSEGSMNLFGRYYAENPRVLKQFVLGFAVPSLIYMIYTFMRNFKISQRINSLHCIAFILYLELFILGCLKLYMFTVPRTSLFFAPIVLWLITMFLLELKKIHPLLSKAYLFLYLGYITIVVFGIYHLLFFTDKFNYAAPLF